MVLYLPTKIILIIGFRDYKLKDRIIAGYRSGDYKLGITATS